LVRWLAAEQAAAVCERFSPIGLACVVVLAGTGFAQGLQLIGSVPALFGTTYGQIAVLKITLFLVALVLAAVNRLWLTDRLSRGNRGAVGHLRLSVCLETCIGLAIVTAAAFMASSPPAAHTTPVWPFSWQFSLITVDEDPDFRREVIVSVAAITVAAALLVAALAIRRFRLLMLVVLAAVLVWRGPSLSLLVVEAYPTSFQTSPTGFSAASIVRGQALFGPNCAACHGADGDGNGPAASGLRIKPADLTAPHLWDHSDGALFWWLTHGIDDPEGGLAMPGFGGSLSEDDRWALIDYVRAHNAGLAMQQDAAFDVPIEAPSFSIFCAGGFGSTNTGLTTADLRGRVVHVVAAETADINVPPEDGLAMITLLLRDTAKPTSGSCVAADTAAWGAYAVLAAVPPDRLTGAGFLVDPDGWLRAARRSDAAWHTRDGLIAAIRDIFADPIKQTGGHHEHHH
jgi:mono/diheme cytochrome c family protein